MKDVLLSPEELADRLGTTEGALAQMRYRGQGPRFVKIGARSVRYRLSDVEIWLEQNTHQQTGDAAVPFQITT